MVLAIAGGLSFSGVEGSDTANASGPRCTVIGTARADVLRGTSRADVICGKGGNDQLFGRGGSDTLRGGYGDDRLTGGTGADHLSGNAGADSLAGNSGADLLAGDSGPDSIVAGDGDDRLLGGLKDDQLFGQEGDDFLDGGEGDDLLDGGRGINVCAASSGADIARCEDREGPVALVSSVSPAVVNTSEGGATVHFRVEATDDLSGIVDVSVAIRAENAPSSSDLVYGYGLGLHRTSGNAYHSIWEGDIKLPRYAPRGTYVLKHIGLRDRARNHRLYREPDLQEAQLDGRVFQEGTIEDRSPPVVTELSFSPSRIDTSAASAYVDFRVRLSDDLAGVSSAGLSFTGPAGPLGGGTPSADLRLTSGSVNDGVWTGRATFQQGLPPGTYRLNLLHLRDATWNKHDYRQSELSSAGFPTAVEQGGEGDTSPPTFLGFSFSPSRIDTSSSDQNMTFTIRGGEDVGEAVHAYLIVQGPTGGYFYPDNNDPAPTGDAHDRTWRPVVKFPRYAARGTYTVAWAGVMNEMGRWNQYDTDELAAAGYPTTFENGPQLLP